MRQPPLTLPASEQHSLGQSILLHLAPGVLIGAVFVLTAPVVQALQLPSFLALCLADLVVLVPLVLGYLLHQGYQVNRRLSLRGIVLYRNTLPRWQYAVLVPLIVVLSATLIVGVSPVSTWVFNAWFSWVPDTFLVTSDLSTYPRTTLGVSYLIFFVLIVVAAPVVEELYFRGYLLPRLSHFGYWAPILHSLLFALFHVWTPWLTVARTIGVLPLIMIVQWKRNIYLGMLAHILVNSIDVIIGVAFMLQHT
jgi:membrane protease YdiL (CAAX protease family)